MATLGNLLQRRGGSAMTPRVVTPYPSFRMATQIGNIAQILDGAIDFYNKPPQEQGEALGKATVSVASEVAIAVATDGLGNLATLRKAEKVADVAEHVRDAEAAVASGRRLLNPGIRITDDGMRHVLERHSVDGIPKYPRKNRVKPSGRPPYASKFNRDEDIRALIEAGSQQPMVNQANGRRARTFRAGHEIGLDRTTGKQTDLMTVITESDGTLVTAFPGEPVTPSSSTKRSD